MTDCIGEVQIMSITLNKTRAGVRHFDGTRDNRYTVAREYCGYETPRQVARFCGHWISSHKTESAAWSAAQRHMARRWSA